MTLQTRIATLKTEQEHQQPRRSWLFQRKWTRLQQGTCCEQTPCRWNLDCLFNIFLVQLPWRYNF